jgi:hypothetical protein
MRNSAQTNGAQTPPPGLRPAAMPTRFDWLMKLAGGTIGWSWQPLFAPRLANLLRTRPDFRLTINSPNDDGTTNSSSARARLKPLKTLA